MGGFSKLFGVLFIAFIAYVALKNNMIDIGNMKAQFVDPYVTPEIINTVQTFISVTMDAVKNFNMKV
jgi:hypothetical protein